MLYTLNLHNVICQLYLNKAGRKRNLIPWKRSPQISETSSTGEMIPQIAQRLHLLEHKLPKRSEMTYPRQRPHNRLDTANSEQTPLSRSGSLLQSGEKTAKSSGTSRPRE